MIGSGTQHGPELEYVPPPELGEGPSGRRPVVVVGAGPVGLAAAIDLALKDVPVLLLDDNDRVSSGSRAICWSKRTLEILDRLGIGDRMLERGVTWSGGKVFHRDRELYGFDLLPEEGHKMPAFVNLQQYYVEEFLIERAADLASLEMRWKNKVVGVSPEDDEVLLEVQTPDGAYMLRAEYVLAADGAHSAIRDMLSLNFQGKVFEDRFLIADVKMTADFPSERWFWFDPPFHGGQSALLHKQADDVWRIDLQLGWDADPEEERQPDRVIPRITQMLGPYRPFDLEWVSIYTFQCRRLERFRHGRVFFVGDSAHVVSPFGARGGNGGLQDIDNLGWKLAAVLRGAAPDALLDSYDEERVHAADENILNSTRSTDFITPKSPISETFRDAVLDLAREHAFARRLVNSGRLSVPASLAGMNLIAPEAGGFAGAMAPGAACVDAPVTLPDGARGWLLNQLGGDFGLLVFGDPTQAEVLAGKLDVPVIWVGEGAAPDGCAALGDPDGLVRRRYDGDDGTVYLIRPDQHVAARWRRCTAADVRSALDLATGRATAGANLVQAGD